MLVALNETENIVNLLELNPTYLADLARQFLRCPACKSQIRLKNGRIKTPHFAHVSLATCQYYSENESLQHLTLKKRLYHWFKQTEQVEIEHFLPDLQQTPDLLVNKTLAIEIQCSHLSIQRLRERTEMYRANGYTVLWLMGKDLWLDENMTEFKRQLLYLTQNAGFYYWELDLQREKLRLKYLCHEDLTGRLHHLQREFDFDSGVFTSSSSNTICVNIRKVDSPIITRYPNLYHATTLLSESQMVKNSRKVLPEWSKFNDSQKFPD